MSGASRNPPRDDESAGPGHETLRRRIAAKLADGEWDFEELCTVFEVTVRRMEAELRHVERSVRARGDRLIVIPPECLECGFIFEEREKRHLHPPGRCPKCRGERITPPRFRIGQ